MLVCGIGGSVAQSTILETGDAFGWLAVSDIVIQSDVDLQKRVETVVLLKQQVGGSLSGMVGNRTGYSRVL